MGGWGTGVSDLNILAWLRWSQNCLVAFYDTRRESSGLITLYRYPQAEFFLDVKSRRRTCQEEHVMKNMSSSIIYKKYINETAHRSKKSRSDVVGVRVNHTHS